MAWSAWVHKTISGQQRMRVFPDTFTWQRVLNGTGTGEAVFLLSDQVTGKIPYHDLFEEVRNTLVFCWDGVPIYAGVITDSDYDADTDSFSLKHSDIRWILKRRKALSDGGEWTPQRPHGKRTLSYRGYSLRGIAAQIIEEVKAAPNGDLPIRYAGFSPREPGPHERNYPGFNLPWADDLLTNLTNVIGGPDIDFVPVWGDPSIPTEKGRLRWLMYAGSQQAPSLALPHAIDVNLDGGSHGVTGLKRSRSAQRQAKRAFGVGDGIGAEMILSVRGWGLGMPPNDFPLLDGEHQNKTVTNLGVLNDHSDGYLAAYSEPIIQDSFSILAHGNPAKGQPSFTNIRPRAVIRHHNRSRGGLPQGWTRSRIIQTSGDQTETARVQCQQIGGDYAQD